MADQEPREIPTSLDQKEAENISLKLRQESERLIEKYGELKSRILGRGSISFPTYSKDRGVSKIRTNQYREFRADINLDGQDVQVRITSAGKISPTQSPIVVLEIFQFSSRIGKGFLGIDQEGVSHTWWKSQPDWGDLVNAHKGRTQLPEARLYNQALELIKRSHPID